LETYSGVDEQLGNSRMSLALNASYLKERKKLPLKNLYLFSAYKIKKTKKYRNHEKITSSDDAWSMTT